MSFTTARTATVCCTSKSLKASFIRLVHLAQANEQVEDVGIVVDHSASLHICIKLSLALRVQRIIKVHLALIKAVSPEHNGPAISQGHGVLL